jgi:hypothetical protein
LPQFQDAVKREASREARPNAGPNAGIGFQPGRTARFLSRNFHEILEILDYFPS